MASWFYIYLYTDHSARMETIISETVMKKTMIDEVIRKETHIMSNRTVYQHNIEIDEATSHWIDVTVNDEDGSAMDLTGCSAVFTAGKVEKMCDIVGNSVSVKLEPEETTGYTSNGYQIRVFDANDDVFQIIQGILQIRLAHKPYTQNPLGGVR